MKKKKYDLIFSLGEACFTATFLKKLCLRAMSTPFDWIAGGTFEKRVDFLLNDFNDFFNKKDLKLIAKRLDVSPADIYQNTKSGIVFNHDFTLDSNFETEYPQVLEKYKRRSNRLIEKISLSKTVLIIFIELEVSQFGIGDKSKLPLYLDKIQQKFPNTRIELLYIRNNNKLNDEEVIYEMVDSRITYCECYNQDRTKADMIGFGNFKNIKHCLKDITCKNHLTFWIKRKFFMIGKDIIKMIYLHNKKPDRTEYIRVFGIKIWKKQYPKIPL